MDIKSNEKLACPPFFWLTRYLHFAGVARAFDETVAPHPEIVKICSQFYKTTDLSSPAMKLACVLTFLFDASQISDLNSISDRCVMLSDTEVCQAEVWI